MRDSRIPTPVRTFMHGAGLRIFGPLAEEAVTFKHPWLRHLPTIMPWRRPPKPWPQVAREAPAELRTVPGTWRDDDAADEAYAKSPLYEFFAIHAESRVTLGRYGWSWVLPTISRRIRTLRRLADVAAPDRQPVAAQPAVDPATLTEDVHAEAQRLGLSKIGIAPYDERYVFDGYDSLERTSVIVCVLEQDFKDTQTIPSSRAERSVIRTYSELQERTAKLAEYLQERGYRAQPQGPGGPVVTIHYAIEAGLGQLGLNGQLLTPEAGSRCRLTVIMTNAELVTGSPVDYGINAICDECQLCVKRCPPGAIPLRRQEHRGVIKAKIKPERCFPVMIQSHGCAVCMKVCPVQRYGLDAVKDHLVETGEILGKGTMELEGYRWIDGRAYGPGQKPRITRELLHPKHLSFDPDRKVPLSKMLSKEEESALLAGD